MARVITERDIREGTLSGTEKFFVYNGLDCCVTREVWDVLYPRLAPDTRMIYRFQLACQRPAMAMMFRGVLVDEKARKEAVATLTEDHKAAEAMCRELVKPYWRGTRLATGPCPKGTNGQKHLWQRGEDGALEDTDPKKVCKRCGGGRWEPSPFNLNSDDQGNKLFYVDIGIPEMTNKKGNVSVDKEVLERIGNKYPKLKPITDAIHLGRGMKKQIGVLESGVSRDGRMRSTFMIGGADTGRQASQQSPLKEGTNLQNIAEKLRFMFVADPGYEMAYADLEQAESNCVAHLAGDENYIRAHKEGDVHTFASRLIWPKLPWNGDMAKDRKIAEATFLPWDPDHPVRYNSKRIQHGSNYMLTPQGIAMIAHIPRAAAEEAQGNYFGAFPGIPLWHRAVNSTVKTVGQLTSPMGRRRQFFGRPWDMHTIRQAVSQDPQSMVADILNTAMCHIWADADPELILLLAQVHDALLFEYRTERRKEALALVLDRMTMPVHIVGIDGMTRSMTIGTDVKTGLNWAKFNDDPKKGRINLGGMR